MNNKERHEARLAVVSAMIANKGCYTESNVNRALVYLEAEYAKDQYKDMSDEYLNQLNHGATNEID